MSKKLKFIIELYDKVTAPLRKTESAFNKVTKSVKKTQSKISILPKSIQVLENELVDLRQKQAQAFSPQAIRHYQKEIKRTEKELKKLNRVKTGGGLKSFGAELKNQIPALGGSLAMMTSPAGIAASAVIGVGVVLKKSTEKAMLFDKGMAKVNGTLQLAPDKLKDVRNQLLKLGASATTGLDKIPDAFYKIVSATGGDLPVSMDIMKASLKGAEAGFTDVNNVADATVNIVNAVGKSNTNATEVMDVLFATLNKGKTEFSEISNYLPKLIPISNNLGTSFKETSGAFAFLTANGLKAEASTTALQNVFKSFGMEKVRKNFENMGVQIFDAQGKMRKITDISKELNTALKGLTDEQRVKKLESLGLDQEASLGMSIMAANADDLRKTIDYVAQSGGEMNRTLAKSSNPMTKLSKLSNMFQAGMTKLGYAVLPVVNNVLEKVLYWSETISKAISGMWQKSELFRDIVAGLGFVFKKAFTMMWTPILKVGKLFVWLGKKIGITGGDVKNLLLGINDFYVNTKSKIQSIGKGFMAVFSLIKKAWESIWSGDFDALKNLNFNSISQAFQEAYNKSQKTIKAQKIVTQTESKKEKVQKVKPDNSLSANSLLNTGNKPASSKQNEDITGNISSITSGGKKQTNINVKLEKLMDGITIMAQDIKEGASEAAEIVQNELLRVLNAANSMS